MALISVHAERAGDTPPARAVLTEHVLAADLASERACAALIERLGWAIVDAEHPERDAPARLTEPVPDR